MRPGASAIFDASATLNGRHICAACRSTGCGLVSRPWMMFGMPSAMLAMSSPENLCCWRSSSIASMPAATRAAAACDFTSTSMRWKRWPSPSSISAGFQPSA